METLSSFFESVMAEYLEWICAHQKWIQSRNRSIAKLDFPFQTYRPGQRPLAVAVYRTIKKRGRLFAEAPTGIGKTMSVLFPSVKALGEGHIEKIFYATAKTIGRAVAESTFADLRAKGLGIRAVTLTAREKICFNNGEPCDLKTCPFAIGYFDRIKNALKASLDRESFTRAEIENLAREHQVCPFELSLDLSLWADAVICDYNYVFDPSASLKRFFSGERQDFAILVDEAHNLVDRAREMFSAVLEKSELLALRSTLKDELPACARVLNRINTRFLKFSKEEGWQSRQEHLVRPGVPEKLVNALRDFCEEAELWLVQNEPSEFRQKLLEFYFQCLAFLRVAELYDERYVTTFELGSGRLRLFCLDPAPQIRSALENIGGAVFFSATLTPIGYYMESLAGEVGHHHLKLDSPFPSENLEILVHPKVTTRLRDRNSSYDEIVAAIAAMARARAGNYLVYFSSYEYMQTVLDRFRARHADIESAVQISGMAESAREEFLARFQQNSARTLVAFAVLGGVFGEGIDLVGDRLIGVAVVGVGLPQLCLERDLIREYWQRDARSGFDFAYTYPGMNRVLQAAGRVIRSERDRGMVLLLDERFGHREHRNLFPPWWRYRTVNNAKEVGQAAARFWSETPEGKHCCEREILAPE
jgi:DNA excision repair protein ERCC-2